MTTPEMQATASRLCAACGMCCNGVLFHSMRLQPSDSERKLESLGLKVKRRKGERHILQPCPAHNGICCTIYAHRPERCRLFECRQLKDLAAGRITEADALAKIQDAQRRVGQVRELFQRAGDAREHKAFAVRFAAIFTEPLDPSQEAVIVRDTLAGAMRELESLLQNNFRIEPISGDK